MIRLAHLSDLHFAQVTYNPMQFFSKRWLGNCNLILFRQKTHQTDRLQTLPKLLKSLDVNFVCITGDLATTALESEFEKSSQYIQSLEKEQLKVFLLPGNHDIYTKESEKSQRFYRSFSFRKGAYTLEKDGMEVHPLDEGWWWVGLDTALATSLVSSNGKFTNEMVPKLKELLKTIPPGDQVVMGNHFPLFASDHPRHDLIGCEKLQQILEAFPNVKLYLHGHDHSPYIINRQEEGFPLVLNSGSSSHTTGTFNLLDLHQGSCKMTQYVYTEEEWIAEPTTEFKFLKDAQ